jgi:hypothetical protein
VKRFLSLCGPCRLALASAFVIASHAQAQTSPYYIGLSQTLGYDSNVFRRDDRTITVPNPVDPVNPIVQAPESSGLISTTSLVGGFDQRIGRQRVHLDGRVGYSSYANQSQLDAPVYAISAGMDWETAEDWSGRLALSVNQGKGPYESRQFDDSSGLVTRVTGAKLTDNSQRAELIARSGAASTSRVWLEGGIVYDHLDRVSDFGPYQVGTAQWIGYREESSSTALSLTAQTRASGALTLGAGLRTTQLNITSGQQWADDVPPANAPARYVEDSRRNSVELLADWVATGASTVNARLSFGQVHYDSSNEGRDERNWAAGLTWAWQPTGKASMSTRLYYDQVDRTNGFAPGSAYSGGDYYTSLSWTGRYVATGKVSVDVSAGVVWRPFDSTFNSGAGVTGQQGDDTDVNLRLGFSYQALRSVSSGCSIGYFAQRSSGTLYAAGAPGQTQTSIRSTTTAYTPSCFVQVVLQ